MWALALTGDDQATFFFIALYPFVVCMISVIFQIRVNKWPATTATLMHVGLQQVSHDNSASDREFRADALYCYQVDGKQYHGSKVSSWEMTGSGIMKNAGLLQLKSIHYLSENQVTAYYKPTNPKKSLLIKPGIKSQLFTAFLGCFMAVLYISRYYF